MGFKEFLNQSEESNINEVFSQEYMDAVASINKKLTASVASSAKGKIIPFVSRVGNTTKIGYDDSNGKSNVLYTFDKPVSKEEERKLLDLIRSKYSEK